MAYRKVVVGGEEFMVPEVRKRSVALGIVVFLAIVTLYSSFYKIGPDEMGVIQRFGKFVRMSGSGLHVKMPLGIETIKKPKIRKRFTQEFGFRTIKAGVQSTITKSSYKDESLMLTGDLNGVVVNWIVQYQIKDPVAYLFNVGNVERTIRDISEVAMRQVVGDRSVDEILTFGRGEINTVAQELMQGILDTYEAGIQIVAVNLQDVDPPTPVKPAFDEVNAAIQDKDRLIQEARKEYNEVVPRAQGEAERMVKDAEAYKIERVNEALGEANRFTALYNEYRKARDVTRRRIYLEMMAEVFPLLEKKFVLEGENGVLKLLDLQGKKGGDK